MSGTTASKATKLATQCYCLTSNSIAMQCLMSGHVHVVHTRSIIYLVSPLIYTKLLCLLRLLCVFSVLAFALVCSSFALPCANDIACHVTYTVKLVRQMSDRAEQDCHFSAHAAHGLTQLRSLLKWQRIQVCMMLHVMRTGHPVRSGSFRQWASASWQARFGQHRPAKGR